jgi:phosphoserine phosphatase
MSGLCRFRGLAASARFALASVLLAIAPAAAQTDPLPSWNDGQAKAAIVGFVMRITAAGSPDFVPVSERVVVFDNDGTLWVEQPIPAQVAFELACASIAEPEHPEWSTSQPFKAALEKDTAFLAQAGEKGFAKIMVATHAGWTTDDYETTLSGWLATTRQDRFGRPYTELVYQPMLELLAYFKANGFDNYILSGNSRDFMRPWVAKVYGVAPDHVIGSSIKTKFEIVNGRPTLIRVPEIDFIDEKEGRPARIYEQIGRRPIAAFGNSDADLEMLQWTTMARGQRLGVVVHHTDAEREYAYDRDADFGRLAKVLDAAAENGWIVVDMKNDWKTVFAFAKQ